MRADRGVTQVSIETGASRKALRIYEEAGLLTPTRDSNGYRRYSDHDIRVVTEIRDLNAIGIPLSRCSAFIDCLNSGSEFADACPASLAEYRKAIETVDAHLEALSERRARLVGNLTAASTRMLPATGELDASNPYLKLPSDLPAPESDGATDHLPGRRLPAISLESTDGGRVALDELGTGRTLLYVFPMTGVPGQDMPDGWDAIPGARGCTPQNCDLRDHYADLVRLGIRKVYGLSSQPAEYQRELADRLRLPYPLLTDDGLSLADDPGLPTFTASGLTLYRRQTLLVTDGMIEHVFYPVFPPDQHASVVLGWIAEHP